MARRSHSSESDDGGIGEDLAAILWAVARRGPGGTMAVGALFVAVGLYCRANPGPYLPEILLFIGNALAIGGGLFVLGGLGWAVYRLRGRAR